jgi:nanoRNase/pAp phosphatase (c-di-AMP/oligoRNAs hydrolase)
MIEDVICALGRENKVILVHANADSDAVGSAYALQRCFPSAVICAPGGVDRVAKLVLDRLDGGFTESCDPTSFDQVVVVDTSSPEQLAPLTGFPRSTVVIDHHTITNKWDVDTYFCDPGKTSCTELVLEIIQAADKDIDNSTALALMAGMLTDSGHFQYARPPLLRAFAHLMDIAGLQMDEAMSVTRNEIGASERAAMLKGAQKARFDRVGDMMVATSQSSSFEASVCRGLLNLGSDVAFVGSQREDRCRISARATQSIVRRGMHLGELLESIGGETESDGGGHGGAAGISGVGDVEAVLHICMEKTMALFREIRKRD